MNQISNQGGLSMRGVCLGGAGNIAKGVDQDRSCQSKLTR